MPSNLLSSEKLTISIALVFVNHIKRNVCDGFPSDSPVSDESKRWIFISDLFHNHFTILHLLGFSNV